MDEIRMKECPDCHGIGDFNDSICCGGAIAADGTCAVCGFKTKRDPCLRCKGEGQIPDDDYVDECLFDDMTEADSSFSQRQLDRRGS